MTIGDYERHVSFLARAIQVARNSCNARAMFEALPERVKPDVRRAIHDSIGLTDGDAGGR